MAKPMLVTFPFVLLLLDAWPFGRLRRQDGGRQIVFRLVAEKVPLIAMSLILGVHHHRRAEQCRRYDVARRRAAVAACRQRGCVVLNLSRHMVWPAGLAALYPYPRMVPAWQVVGALLVSAPVTAVAVRSGIAPRNSSSAGCRTS